MLKVSKLLRVMLREIETPQAYITHLNVVTVDKNPNLTYPNLTYPNLT
jgi:hypothetical protein